MTKHEVAYMTPKQHAERREAIVQMYVYGNMTQKQVAERLGMHKDTLQRLMKRLGIEATTRTCPKDCSCGKPIERMRSRRDADGVVFAGRLCHEHRIEHYRKYKAEHEAEWRANYERYRKSDKGRATATARMRRW